MRGTGSFDQRDSECRAFSRGEYLWAQRVLHLSLGREPPLLALPSLDSQTPWQDMRKTCLAWRVRHYSHEAGLVRFAKRLETSPLVFERHLGGEAFWSGLREVEGTAG